MDKEKTYYVRGLLGLAPFYEFNKVGARFNIEIKGKDKFRFASPIKYLPISYNRVIVLVDYSKIADFRKEVSRVTFSFEESKESNLKNEKGFNAKIPSEEQYSIHQLFKKNGVIVNNTQKGRFNYSVISDIEL